MVKLHSHALVLSHPSEPPSETFTTNFFSLAHCSSPKVWRGESHESDIWKQFSLTLHDVLIFNPNFQLLWPYYNNIDT